MHKNLWILFFIYLAILLCVAGSLMEYYSHQIVMGGGGETGTGGTFDLSAFLNTVKKKYKSIKNGSAIEVEIKLLRQELFDKIIEWIRQHKYTESNTTNQIWSQDGLISTIDADGNKKWSRKKRISKFMLPIGKLTIALEESDVGESVPIGEPIVIRQKQRISTPLNKHWRIDCTWVNNEQTPEIEMEYIGEDYWNAPHHTNEIEEFLVSLE